jgi:hypothetical protein
MKRRQVKKTGRKPDYTKALETELAKFHNQKTMVRGKLMKIDLQISSQDSKMHSFTAEVHGHCTLDQYAALRDLFQKNGAIEIQNWDAFSGLRITLKVGG